MRQWIVGAALSFTVVATDALQAQRAVDRPPSARDRAALEERFTARFAEVIRDRVGLTAGQMDQLREVNRRFEPQRRSLFVQERNLRREMRAALGAGDDAATQDRVAQLMESALRIQRQRLDLLESEQRALAAFMSPVQRARYFGLQEQMRRRVAELRQGSSGEEKDNPFAIPERRQRMRSMDRGARIP